MEKPTVARIDASSGDHVCDGQTAETLIAAAPADRRLSRRGEAPLVLDRYRLHRQLGAGAFGSVWMARDERLERDVAVKIVPRDRIVGGRFEREARAAARLAHPGIVTLYEAGADDDGAYLVSELVRGSTLGDLLDAGRLSDREIVGIGIALCDALAHAHAENIVHRDVKPSNVLVPERPSNPASVAKLTDFGVARIVGGDTLTRTGDVVGTAAYMAPEQAEGREVGAAADLYALALVLYEGLTGVNPIRTGTAAQRARRLGAHLPPLRRQRRDLPRELGQAIDLALRPRPRERGAIGDLRRALALVIDRMSDLTGVVAPTWTPRSGGEPLDEGPLPLLRAR
ncbi:MAG: serine/threonine protein kinase, partial [Actinomycetota bacterium]|nr:serine/threonine protein kinase [Actinomycetota bacterium]